MLFEEKFLIALALTIIIETAVLFAVARFAFKKTKKDISDEQVLFAGFFASIATLPYLWFVLPPFVNAAHYVWIGEALVVLAETIILRQLLKLRWREALAASIVCNAVSFAAGLLLSTTLFF